MVKCWGITNRTPNQRGVNPNHLIIGWCTPLGHTVVLPLKIWRLYGLQLASMDLHHGSHSVTSSSTTGLEFGPTRVSAPLLWLQPELSSIHFIMVVSLQDWTITFLSTHFCLPQGLPPKKYPTHIHPRPNHRIESCILLQHDWNCPNSIEVTHCCCFILVKRPWSW